MPTRPNGGDVVAEALVREGVPVIFTLCGGHISPIAVASRQRGIAVIDVREEATAVFAADAMSRLTRVPGVAAVTAGPWVTNAITALKNAQLAQSPLVLLGGATATLLKGRGALQDIDQVALVRPHVKWHAAVDRVADLAPAIAEAFARASRDVPGPVFVECPVDLLYPETVVRSLYGMGTGTARSMGERLARWYVGRHLRRVFAQAPARPAGPGRPEREVGLDALAAKAAAALARAERPALVIGSQAVAGDTAVDELVTALDRLGVPMFLSGMARGLLGGAHPLQFRHQRKAALREADVVLLAGTPCDFRLEYGRQINPRALLVSVNRSPEDVSRNRRPQIGVMARPDRFLVRLAQQASRTPDRSAWLAVLRAREQARDREIAERSAVAVRPVNPLLACQAIEQRLTANSVLVADGGDFVATASYIVRPRAPRSWLDPGVFGTLGVGAGFVLGAHAARPGADLWAIYGDGALGFSLVEFHTFVRHRVPVVAVVGNDGKWAQIARDQVDILGDDVATVLGRVDYHRVVEGFGARGFLVDRPDLLDAALDDAQASAREGVPALVNVLVGDTDFRKGSLSL
jgi:acetolactate synthase-1/2/3 large subunit